MFQHRWPIVQHCGNAMICSQLSTCLLPAWITINVSCYCCHSTYDWSKLTESWFSRLHNWIVKLPVISQQSSKYARYHHIKKSFNSCQLGDVAATRQSITLGMSPPGYVTTLVHHQTSTYGKINRSGGLAVLYHDNIKVSIIRAVSASNRHQLKFSSAMASLAR